MRKMSLGMVIVLVVIVVALFSYVKLADSPIESNTTAGGVIEDDFESNTDAKASGISGVVALGPTCPVVRIGDETCDNSPYKTAVDIYLSENSPVLRSVETNQEGEFYVDLSPGEYLFKPRDGGLNPPYCEGQKVTLTEGNIEKVEFLCDSGIR